MSTDPRRKLDPRTESSHPDSSHPDDSTDASQEGADDTSLDEVCEFDEPDDQEEFSLEMLSQAYVKVIKDKFDASHKVDGDLETLQHGDPATRSDVSQGKRDRLRKPSVATHDNVDEPKSDDDASCPIKPESIVEAILFVGAPTESRMTTRKLASMLRDVTPKEISSIVKKLNARYEAEQAVFRIRSENGVLSLELEESMIPFQRHFFGKDKAIKLNPAAIEVLAVVAYRQPITREQVDQIRKKNSGSILRQLIRRELLLVSPDKKDQLITGDKFLQLFNLEILSDLPQTHEVADLEELI